MAFEKSSMTWRWGWPVSISQHLSPQLLGSRMTRAQKFKVCRVCRSVIERSDPFWAQFPNLNRWYWHLWTSRKNMIGDSDKRHLDCGAKVANALSEAPPYHQCALVVRDWWSGYEPSLLLPAYHGRTHVHVHVDWNDYKRWGDFFSEMVNLLSIHLRGFSSVFRSFQIGFLLPRVLGF